jgi:hypothetical protein
LAPGEIYLYGLDFVSPTREITRYQFGICGTGKMGMRRERDGNLKSIVPGTIGAKWRDIFDRWASGDSAGKRQ